LSITILYLLGKNFKKLERRLLRPGGFHPITNLEGKEHRKHRTKCGKVQTMTRV